MNGTGMRVALAGALVGLLYGAATPAAAGTYPHERNGFSVGFGLGGGSLGVEDGDEREGSGIGAFRIGYAPSPDLMLHLETEGWTKKFDDPLGDTTWTFSVAAASVTWFPGGGGGLLRGGVGVGVASVELDLGGGVTLSADESGIAFVAAGGYEWRLTQKFALGPEVNFFWMDLDELGSANQIGGTLNFDWYW